MSSGDRLPCSNIANDHIAKSPSGSNDMQRLAERGEATSGVGVVNANRDTADAEASQATPSPHNPDAATRGYLNLGLKRLQALWRRFFPSNHTKNDVIINLPASRIPFREHVADDAGIWKIYSERARVYDEDFSKLLDSYLDSLLIFVRLTSPTGKTSSA
jgi:hypothetical protein